MVRKNFSFNTQKRNRAEIDLDEDFFKLLVNAAFGKLMENFRNRLKIEITKNYEYKKILKNNQN